MTTPPKKPTFDGNYSHILYSVKNNIATIAINRPEKLNAFTQHTIYEWEDAFRRAEDDKNVGVIVRQTNSPYEIVEPTVQVTDINNVTVIFASPPTTNQYTVTVLVGGGAPGPTGPQGASNIGLIVALGG